MGNYPCPCCGVPSRVDCDCSTLCHDRAHHRAVRDIAIKCLKHCDCPTCEDRRAAVPAAQPRPEILSGYLEREVREARLNANRSIACALCGAFICRAYEYDLQSSFFFCTTCAPVGP